MTIFYEDDEEGGGETLPPPDQVANASELHDAGPWVVRCRIKGKGKTWFYQKVGDEGVLTSRVLMTEMVTYDDPYVADGVRRSKQWVYDRSEKGRRKYEVATLDQIRGERSAGVY